MTFSLCMIVRNEERTLKRCLDSVAGVFDEIVIVDTGSADRTKVVAKAYTDKVYDFAWCDDFSAARNFSFSKAVCDYIMWLDADDVLSEENRNKLIELKNKISPEIDVVMMKYAISFDGAGNPTYYYYRERLVKRLGGFMWNGFVHEVITPKGNVIYEDICVYHFPDSRRRKDPARNLKLFEKMVASGVKLSARQTYYYGRELYYNGKYDLAAKHLESFLGFPGAWYADKIGACVMLYEIYENSFPERAREIIAKALSYETVNPQVLCLMGDSHKRAGSYEQAIFWYNAALGCPEQYRQAGFILPEYEKYYPYLQMCVCYDRLGKIDKAKECNRLAGEINPLSSQVKYNNDYFASLEKKQQE